jgi:ribosomal protein L40E
MALIDCKECNGVMSDLADACPHCGAPAHVSIKKEESKIHCFECSAELPSGTETCLHCGVSQSLKSTKKEEPKKTEAKHEDTTRIIIEPKVVYVQEKQKSNGFSKFFLWLFIIIMVLVVSAFSYDYYMRHSGIRNRINYESNKMYYRDKVNNGPIHRYEEWNDERKQRKEERREERRRKRQEFWNN